ncbi:MAG: GGDEF domain-containing response regulator [Rhodocyclaceae bacterium]|nr:MAG: GGDEF domain-containing response regulator [Rhodocyclaceae bacterium]
MQPTQENEADALKQILCGASVTHLPKPSFRFLLVDDEPRLLQSLYEMLDNRGYELIRANSGEAAVNELLRLRFDIVLLDLRLPGMSGHEVMDFIKTRGLDCHTIVLSGNTEIDAAIGALKRGAYDFLRKPYAPEELLKIIANALQERELARENQRIAAQLESSEKLYRYLVDSSPDIIYTLDQAGRFTFLNQRATTLLGYDRDELLGRHYSEIVFEEDLERALYVFNERRVGERATRNVELRLKCVTGKDDTRHFDNALMTIAFNSDGIYLADAAVTKREYYGTYGVARDITDRKRAEEQVAYQAYHDVLTDLPNRALFRDRLELAIMQARRNARTLAVMFVDLDRFKIVNDSLGHVTGDLLLQEVAARLKLCLRQSDTLARHGGDEFTLVLPEIADGEDAEHVAGKILESLSRPFDLNGHEVFLSGSIGIALYPEHGSTGEQLVRHADIAMYRVKRAGKNGVQFFTQEMFKDVHYRATLEKDLRKAIDNNELEVYFQPQFDVFTNRIIGAEGLMRWHHPSRGLLTPGEFLPLAEENGLILQLSEWLLESVCTTLKTWDAAGKERLKISINVSPQHLDRGIFCEAMFDALKRHRIMPQRIEVEITENICIGNPQQTVEQLHRLHAMGVSTAIDDFGTGYSSLAYLHRFPVDTIKIDQSFVREIARENGHYPVVLAIISIARGLKLNLVAEGVETEAQCNYLKAHGCSVMQGFHFSPAISSSEFLTLLAPREKKLAR